MSKIGGCFSEFILDYRFGVVFLSVVPEIWNFSNRQHHWVSSATKEFTLKYRENIHGNYRHVFIPREDPFPVHRKEMHRESESQT